MPSTQEQTVRSLEALKAGLMAPDSDFLHRAAGLVQALHEQLGGHDGDESLAVHRGEGALLLLRLAEAGSGDASLVKAILASLLEWGRMGRLCVCDYLRTCTAYSLPQLTGLLKDLGVQERLLLVHELLLHPRRNDRQLTAWTRDLLLPLASADLEEGLEFFAKLGLEGAQAAYPVRRTLMRGEFGRRLHQRLNLPVEEADFDRLRLAASALGDEEIAGRLAELLAGLSDKAAIRSIPGVCCMAARNNQALARVVFTRLKESGEQAQLACLDGLREMAWRNTGLAAAGLFKKRPKRRKALSLRLALLPLELFDQFMQSLSDKERLSVYAYVLAVISRMAPEFVRARLDLAKAGEGPDPGPKAVKSLLAQLKAVEASPPLDVSPLQPATRPADSSEEESAGWMFSRKGSAKKGGLAQALEGLFEVADQKLSGSSLAKTKVANKAFLRVDLAQSRLSKVRFQKVRLAAVSLQSAELDGCSFSGCDFSAVRFEDARLDGGRFQSCNFDSCDFSRARLEKTVFIGCRFKRCLFTAAEMEQCGGSFTRLEACTLAGARLRGRQFKSCRLERVDLTGAAVHGARFFGLEACDVVLERAVLHDCEVLESELEDCCNRGLRILGSVVDDPCLLAAARRTRREVVAALEGDPGLKVWPPSVTSEGASFAEAAVRAFLFEQDLAAREELLAANDQRRRRWGREKMEPRQADFFVLLPYLLHTDAFERGRGLDGVPACAVAGYEPGYTAVRLLKEFFPDYRPQKVENPLVIEAVYTIGSIGSLAQTGQSDIDYWVCCDTTGQAPDVLDRLRVKLEALTAWAEEAFGLEAYFFAMDMDAVQANDFGLSDEESSGSAQALLLKEEFYRTAVRVAGRRLFWWAAPPGVDEARYRRDVEQARRYPHAGQPRLADAGHLGPISPDEYFGACLWQIVKAVKSPYKSVMKLGLLEKYAKRASRDGLMLCDRIKANILEGRGGVSHVDPYAALFKELADAYWAAGDKEAVRLLREAFVLKVHPERFDTSLGFPVRKEEDQLIRFLFGAKASDQEVVKKAKAAGGFEKTTELGGMVNRFMMGAYKRIQSELQSAGGSSMITDEDLTKLGRKIFAAFAPKPGKVERLPFFDAKGAAFAELAFSAEKAPGKKPLWMAKGCPKGAKMARKDMPVVRQDANPVGLLLWLAANGIHDETVRLDCDGDISPLSAVDVQALMDKLHECFPVKEVFDAAPAETLKPERATRALFVVNLGSPPKLKKVERVSVVYATNWGELFCRDVARLDPAGARQPVRWLKQAAPELEVQGLKMDQYLPRKCACPRLPLV